MSKGVDHFGYRYLISKADMQSPQIGLGSSGYPGGHPVLLMQVFAEKQSQASSFQKNPGLHFFSYSSRGHTFQEAGLFCLFANPEVLEFAISSSVAHSGYNFALRSFVGTQVQDSIGLSSLPLLQAILH